MFFKSARRLAGLAAVAGALFATSASADVLTFDGAICNGGAACVNIDRIDQSYGDTVGLDVVWDENTSFGGLQGFVFWASGYSDLTNVAIASNYNTMEVYLKPLAGYQVQLNGFKLGGWRGFEWGSDVTVLGGNLDPIFASGTIQVGSTASFGPYGTREDGFRIRLGGDTLNVAIDSIDFKVSAIGPAAIPEPATWAMMILGFGFAGTAIRSRRRALA